MIKKKILNPDRIRRISGGFSFIPHRFLCEGFLASLHQKELLLYLFLVLAADRHGLQTGRPNVLIELRHDLIEDEAGQTLWAAHLAPILTSALAKSGL